MEYALPCMWRVVQEAGIDDTHEQMAQKGVEEVYVQRKTQKGLA